MAYFYPDSLFANPCEQSDYEMLEKSGKNNKKAQQNADIIVYPNPTSGLINILTNPESKNSIHRIQVYNYLGIKVKDILILNANEGVIQIDVTSFLSGIYLLKAFKTDNTSDVLKIQKQ